METSHRIDELRRRMSEEGLDAVLVMNPDNQFYLSGFRVLIYSRPILYLVDENKTSIIVPGLEEAHAEHENAADDVLVYYEHPEMASKDTSHLDHLDRLLKSCPSSRRIGLELSFCPVGLARHVADAGFEVEDIGRTLVEMRYVKDEAEIRAMEEAGRLVNLAVGETLAACRPGATELGMDSVGTAALFEETTRSHPEATLDLLVMSPSGPKRSVMPHVFSNTRELKPGDVLIHSRQVALNGYRAELERTVVVGEPSREQQAAFEAAREAQRVALDFIRPGVMAREVDEVARRVIRDAGFGDRAIHRVGHGLGLSTHEEPYLRFDNDLAMEEGMAYSIEPGIYIPGLGGFRHSDTVVLTADGSRLITDYPRDLESLTVRG